VLKEKIDANELVTSDLTDDISEFDQAAIVAMAKGYRK
jgi:hypothetical protein